MKFLIILALAVAASALPEPRLIHRSREMPVVGSIEGRITGGSDAAVGQFPSQVGLSLYVNAFTGAWCGGSLIGETWVLTAAHCLDGIKSVTVYLGSTKRTSAEVTHTVSSGSFIIHKDWDSSNLKNDIALIKIPAVAYSTKIAASKLPALASSYSTYAGDSAIASGWGRTSDASSSVSADLKFAIMTIITNAVCQGTYGSVVTGGNICVATTNGVSTCNGDSGGPLFLESNKEQVGLTSFGAAAGCQKGYPGSFTRVTYFRSWIKENTQI